MKKNAPRPLRYLEAGEYVVVVEGFSTEWGTYELSVECMSLTGVESIDVASAVVLSGIECSDFGTIEEAGDTCCFCIIASRAGCGAPRHARCVTHPRRALM